jgi:hypothetical protein
MFEAKMPKKMLESALVTANHLRNVCATSTTDKTPYELFTKSTPDLSMLRVFGCVVHVAVPEENRKKLDKRSQKAMFVGYESGRKGWKVMLFEEGKWKTQLTRDAAFEEEKMAHPVLADLTTEEDDDTDKQWPFAPEVHATGLDKDVDAEAEDTESIQFDHEDATAPNNEGGKKTVAVPQSTRFRSLKDIVSGNGKAAAVRDVHDWDNPLLSRLSEADQTLRCGKNL